MKIFFFKSIVILFLFLVAYHYSINHTIKFIKNEIENNFSKESLEIIKIKLREEMKNAINKELYINKEDAILINGFLNKILNDLKIEN